MYVCMYVCMCIYIYVTCIYIYIYIYNYVYIYTFIISHIIDHITVLYNIHTLSAAVLLAFHLRENLEHPIHGDPATSQNTCLAAFLAILHDFPLECPAKYESGGTSCYLRHQTHNKGDVQWNDEPVSKHYFSLFSWNVLSKFTLRLQPQGVDPGCISVGLNSYQPTSCFW